MSGRITKIMCLEKILRFGDNLDQMQAHLHDQRISDRDFTAGSLSDMTTVTKSIYELLEEAEAKRKIQMLTFDWQLLPVEKASVTIVFDNNLVVLNA